MGALGNLCFILAIIVFIFAVMGKELFGVNYTTEYFKEEPRWNFINFLHSFMIVFRVLCGEWIESMWDCIHCTSMVCVPFFLLTMIVVGPRGTVSTARRWSVSRSSYSRWSLWDHVGLYPLHVDGLRPVLPTHDDRYGTMWDCIHCSSMVCVPFFLLTMIIVGPRGTVSTARRWSVSRSSYSRWSL